MENRNILGQKIREFRKRAKMSQMDLELAIETSPGSLSRIENGVVNPTKETLNKLIEILKMSGEEAAGLYGIPVENQIVKWLTFAKKVNSIENYNDLIQTAVDEAPKFFNISAASLFLVDSKKNIIRSSTFTNTWYTKLIRKMIPVPYDSLALGLNKNSSNLIVKSVITGTSYHSFNFEEFSAPTISKQLSNLISNLVKFRSGLVIPLKFNGKVIGAILFHKTERQEFTNEVKDLEVFSDYIALALNNLTQFNTLRKEIMKFDD